MTSIPHTLCIAPMMDWSDRHCRYFWRLLSPRALLYTEMVTTGALIHGPRERLLEFDAAEHPVALQLGGNDPEELAQCARWAQERGYDEVNLNCGCPSNRVQSGAFGACLMQRPGEVAACVAAMREACDIPVTVKHRIGVDDMESYNELAEFVAASADVGCGTFIVHARKAWLQGLSPKENREVPPLNYPWVYRLKQDFPSLAIVVNGGITTEAECREHLRHVDGVMLGREAYQNPWVLTSLDDALFQESAGTPQSRKAVIAALIPYVERELSRGTRLNQITRHLMGLYQGLPGARRFRRHLSENAHRPGAGLDVLLEADRMVTETGPRTAAWQHPGEPLLHAQ